MAQNHNNSRKVRNIKTVMSLNKDICPKCENQVKEEGLGCEECGYWFHISCLEISKEQYNFISDKEELLFVCKTCKNKNKLKKTR